MNPDLAYGVIMFLQASILLWCGFLHYRSCQQDDAWADLACDQSRLIRRMDSVDRRIDRIARQPMLRE